MSGESGRVKVCAALALLLSMATALAKEPELKSSPLAQAFGSAPAMWGARLSPDGSKISFIRRQPLGPTRAAVLDTTTGALKVVVDGERDQFDISWCDWASDERLLCGLRSVIVEPLIAYPLTRLVAVNSDGSAMKVLVAQRIRETFTQFQDRVIDWLPGDNRHVLIQVPATEGSGVQRIDIYTGDMSVEERDRDTTLAWTSDGHGVTRLYQSVTSSEERWYVREKAEQHAEWSDLHRAKLEDLADAFSPIGFTDNRNELLYYDQHEGRRALFAMDLANGRKTRLVYSRPDVDVDSVLSLGKFHRLVAASYITDRLRLEFFDPRLADIHGRLSTALPGKQIAIFDENWTQRYYLVYAGSDQDPGTYYRFDAEKNQLMLLSLAYPSLKGRELSPMREIKYTAKDGTAIPAYLTVPAGGPGRKPAILLPHGGPSSRDYWSYDFLVQYFVASGYAVLQSNYRGSEGYGAEWQGAGGFRNWHVAISDILDGADYLVKEGIADADHVCAVGWSYGGYASLMSAIEEPKRFRCVVSIAGVTDPLALGVSSKRYIGGRAAAEFIGAGDDLKNGSPIKRVADLSAPVLLAHGRHDLAVPFAQSESFSRSLSRARKDYEFIEYEFAEHSIEEERYRIDLLTRVGDFLGRYLGAH